MSLLKVRVPRGAGTYWSEAGRCFTSVQIAAPTPAIITKTQSAATFLPRPLRSPGADFFFGAEDLGLPPVDFFISA